MFVVSSTYICVVSFMYKIHKLYIPKFAFTPTYSKIDPILVIQSTPRQLSAIDLPAKWLSKRCVTDCHCPSRGAVQYKKLILNSNLEKSRSYIIPASVSKSLWNFLQSKAVIPPCSMLNFETIRLLKWMLWTNEISRGLTWRWVSDEYHIAPHSKNR